MEFLDTFLKMLVILFAIAMGYLAHRLGILGADTDAQLSKLLLTITLPAMVIGSVLSSEELPSTEEILSLLWVSAVFYGVQIIAALVAACVMRGTPEQRGVVKYSLMFSNFGFIGYPVVLAFFGQEALLFAVIMALPANVISITLAPYLLSGAGQFHWKQFISPASVSSVIALVLALARIRPPALVGEALSFVGGVTTPLSLLLVGSTLAQLPVRQVLTSGRAWIVSALRLLAMPALLWLVLQGMGAAALVLSVAVIQAAMPAPASGTMYCKKYGGDAAFMAQVTFLSTAASMLTIPLIAVWLL